VEGIRVSRGFTMKGLCYGNLSKVCVNIHCSCPWISLAIPCVAALGAIEVWSDSVFHCDWRCISEVAFIIKVVTT